jgi:lipoprotein-anchoring transpeptidase ErfK/SrfK
MKNNTKKINKINKNKTKKQFLYNPKNPKKSFDVYIDKNPKDTIHIKYTTLEDVKNTIDKLEKLYKNKKYTHKRIWQVGMILKVRLKVLQRIKPKQYALANKYFKFLGKRTALSETDRRKILFEY